VLETAHLAAEIAEVATKRGNVAAAPATLFAEAAADETSMCAEATEKKPCLLELAGAETPRGWGNLGEGGCSNAAEAAAAELAATPDIFSAAFAAEAAAVAAAPVGRFGVAVLLARHLDGLLATRAPLPLEASLPSETIRPIVVTADMVRPQSQIKE